MKQSKIITAYNTIEELRNLNVRYPSTVSHALFTLKKVLQDQYEFQSEEEKKIFDELKPTPEDGRLQFASPEDAQKFVERMNELGDLEVDLVFNKPTIRLTDDLGLTLSEIEALDDFIVFEE